MAAHPPSARRRTPVTAPRAPRRGRLAVGREALRRSAAARDSVLSTASFSYPHDTVDSRTSTDAACQSLIRWLATAVPVAAFAAGDPIPFPVGGRRSRRLDQGAAVDAEPSDRDLLGRIIEDEARPRRAHPPAEDALVRTPPRSAGRSRGTRCGRVCRGQGSASRDRRRSRSLSRGGRTTAEAARSGCCRWSRSTSRRATASANGGLLAVIDQCPLLTSCLSPLPLWAAMGTTRVCDAASCCARRTRREAYGPCHVYPGDPLPLPPHRIWRFPMSATGAIRPTSGSISMSGPMTAPTAARMPRGGS